MKSLFAPFLGCIISISSVCFAETGVIWRTGFEASEGYTVSNLFGQDTWQAYPMPDVVSIAYVTNAVADSVVPEGTQCAWLPIGAGVNPRSAASRMVDLSSVDVSEYYVRVRCKFFPDGSYNEFRLYEFDGEFTNMICRMLRFDNPIPNLWFAADGDDDGVNDWVLGCGPLTADWYDWSVLLDLQRKKIIEVTISNADFNIVFDCTKTNNVETTTGTVGFYKNSGRVASTLNAVYFQNGGESGTRSETYVDDIVITTEPMPPGPPKMKVNPPYIDFSRLQSNGAINVVNAGTGSFTYTATILEPQSWLSIDHNSATVTIEDGISVSIDRTGLADGYFHSSIFLDAGDMGATTVQIMVASGTIFYFSDFEHDTVGSLRGQDLWTGDPGNTADVTNDFNSGDGNFVFIHSAGGYDGFNRYLFTIPPNILVRIGAKVYVPEFGGADSFKLDTRDIWHRQLDFVVIRNGDQCSLTSEFFNVNLPAVPVDEWFDLEVTMDLQSLTLVSAKFGENMQVFTNVDLIKPGDPDHAIQGVGVDCESFGDSAAICFDDIFIQEIPRGGPPALTTTPSKEIPLTASSIQFTLVNDGTGSITYTATVVDSAPWLTVSPTNGTFSDTENVTCTVDRGGLAPDYHRCLVAFDGGPAGTVTSMVMVSAGGVYYATDFSEPWYHEGTIASQDSWQNVDQLLYGADVTNLPASATQCLLIHSSSDLHDGIQRPITMQHGELVKLSARFYMPGYGGADTIMFPTRNEKLNNIITRDSDLGLVDLSLPDFPEFSVPSVMTDTWFTFSYTMDLTLQELVQIQFGDTITNLTDMFLLNASEPFFNNIAVFCPTNTPESAGVLVDDITLEAIPEPGTIILLLLLVTAGALWQGKR